METIVNKNAVVTADKTKSEKMNFWDNLEFKRFSVIPMLLIVIGCLGGLSAAFGAMGSTVKLALLAFPTIISLAFMLAVAPMRIIVWTSAIAVLLDILIILF